MMNRQVYLYAFDELHKPVDCKFLENEAITIRNLNGIAEWMADTRPNIRAIYAMDNRRGLRREFTEACKTADFVVQFAFEDMVSREGLQLVKR